MSAKQQAFDYFRQQGWSAEQSAGIVANLIAESGLNPNAVGDRGTAFGIAQWRGSRQAGFHAHLGKPIAGSTLAEQLAWVHAELQGPERTAGDLLRSCTTAAQAAETVCRAYERPADPDGESAKRARLAAQLLAEMSTSGAAIDTSAGPVRGADMTQPAAPIIEGSPRMVPLLPIFGPLIAEMIPQVAKIFDPKSEVAKRNVALGQLIADKFVQASGEKNLQSAVEAAQASPELAKQVQKAVVSDPEVMQLLEVGGGIAKAREHDLAVMTADAKFWFSPAFWITFALLPLLYWTVGAVLMNWGGGFVQEIRASTVGTVIGMILGGVMGYWLGTSFSGKTKDATIQDLSRKV